MSRTWSRTRSSSASRALYNGVVTTSPGRGGNPIAVMFKGQYAFKLQVQGILALEHDAFIAKNACRTQEPFKFPALIHPLHWSDSITGPVIPDFLSWVEPACLANFSQAGFDNLKKQTCMNPDVFRWKRHCMVAPRPLGFQHVQF